MKFPGAVNGVLAVCLTIAGSAAASNWIDGTMWVSSMGKFFG